MNVLKRFTINSLKLNKKRTIVTIAGIILSTALITSISGIVSSFQKTFINNTIKTVGNYHTTFFNIPKVDQNIITGNKEIDSYFVTSGIGYSKLNGSKSKPFIYLMEFDDNALSNYGLKLVSGRMPKSSNEIVISNQIEQSGKIKYDIGQKITLDIFNVKLSEKDTLNQEISFSEELLESMKSNIQNLNTKKFTIVGIIERPNLEIEPYVASGYTAITLMDNINNSANFSVKFKNIKDTYSLTEKISKSDNDNQNGYKYIINSDLLRFSGVSKDDNILLTVGILITIIILIIVISSIFVISNSFEISISEKMKQYSIFSSIGASKKQIRKNVLLESIILAIIGIPIGIVVGIFLTYLLIQITTYILEKSNNLGMANFIFDIPYTAIIISIMLSFITVYLSSMRSAKKAGKVSPIEAIRGNQDIRITNKEVKTPMWIKSAFGVGGQLAYKNIKRNSKKYRTTIISLIISITIFISLNSFLLYSKDLSENLYKKMTYNISINYNAVEEEKEKYNTFLKISEFDGIKEFMINRSINLSMDLYDKVSDSEKELYKKMCNNKNDLMISVQSLGKEEYIRYVSELGKTYDEVKNGIIFVTNQNTYADNNGKKVKLLNLSIGDKLTGSNIKDGKNIYLDVVYVTNKTPMGYENISSYYGLFFISDEVLEKSTDYNVNALYINSLNPDEISDKASTLTDKLYITNYEKEQIENNRIVLLISIFLYGFVTIITIIGLTSVFNTLTTSMNLRSKEFAMLRSIGTTKREFNKMINLESIFYGVKSLFWGITIGIILSIIIYKVMSGISEVTFRLPIAPILISIIFIIVVIRTIMGYSIFKINKQNIIETIRKDNI